MEQGCGEWNGLSAEASSAFMAMDKRERQAIVIPLFGQIPTDMPDYLSCLAEASLLIILVDNRLKPDSCKLSRACLALCSFSIFNGNRGGVAGGYNCGAELARQLGASVITFLDQDSRLTAQQLYRLSQDLQSLPGDRNLIGPWVVDQRRGRPLPPVVPILRSTRMLISSGTTFKASSWDDLGFLYEPLEVDYVDHQWCYNALSRGFRFYQQSEIVLFQIFGERHPSRLCHLLGMQLYSPRRHYTGIRNLRWMLCRSYVPFDFKLKESLKMLLKPFFWLLFEPRRAENIHAVQRGLIDRPVIFIPPNAEP